MLKKKINPNWTKEQAAKIEKLKEQAKKNSIIFDMMESDEACFYDMDIDVYRDKLSKLTESTKMFIMLVAHNNRLDKRDKALKILIDGKY